MQTHDQNHTTTSTSQLLKARK